MSQSNQLERMAALCERVIGALYSVPPHDHEAREAADRRRRGALVGQFSLQEAQVTVLDRVKRAAIRLKASPSRESLASLFSVLEGGEGDLAMLETGRAVAQAYAPAGITGAKAEDLANIAAHALGVRYVHVLERSDAEKDAAVDRLFSTLGGNHV